MFTTNAHNFELLLPPLLQQLALFEGCQIGTMEVLWKYYRAATQSHQQREVRRSLSSQDNNTTRSSLPVSSCEDTSAGECSPLAPLSLVVDKLSDDDIDRFMGIVDNSYQMSILREYTGFVVLDGFLLDCLVIWRMYDKMRELFPLIHLVLALAVKGPWRGLCCVVSAACDIGGNDALSHDVGGDDSHTINDIGGNDALPDDVGGDTAMTVMGVWGVQLSVRGRMTIVMPSSMMCPMMMCPTRTIFVITLIQIQEQLDRHEITNGRVCLSPNMRQFLCLDLSPPR